MELKKHLAELFSDYNHRPAERKRLIELILLFDQLPPPPESEILFPQYPRLHEQFAAAIRGKDPDQAEEAFLGLYCNLHGYEADYTDQERKRLDETGGYWCHAGGLSPILKAEPHIGPQTVSADFGAGNGLQGLLLQKLYPHARTVQIEISAEAVRIGKLLQDWLAIPEAKMQWLVTDVCEVRPEGMDFIYLYRPVRPVGEGRIFYQNFAEVVSKADKEIVIFSIADCLKDFLPDSFEIFYTDGHLTCFRQKT